MRALRAAIRRDPFRQVLSAAFNLNTPLVDDRPGRSTSSHVHPGSARFAAGLLGIELTYAGGFDKVTWDGTADTYPSRCVLEQLEPRESVLLVHAAHERGLLTYFSAGFRFEHLAAAVETGVDGVGVGGAQILRYMDKVTGHHGPFLPANIGTILQIRDTAEQGLRGRAAALLARLDRQHFELSITEDHDALRRELVDALCDDRGTDQLLPLLARTPARTGEAAEPLLAWVARLQEAGSESRLARELDARRLIDGLAAAADRHDLDYLAERLAGLRREVDRSSLDLAA
jgi:hypothetical protein